MVASGHEEVVRIEKPEAEEHENALDRERSSVDKVAVKQIRVGFRRKAVELKDVQQIIVLAVDVAWSNEP